jgi:NAD(P)-dependent dehydrogenase (short-subunit alcohol dehydrogenase family)
VELQGKVAIVTGGGGGLAGGMVPALAAAGADVVVADVDRAKAQKLATAVPSHGRRLFPVQCDISSKTSVDAMVEATVREFGRIDILVNNAAIFPRHQFEQITEQEWDRVMAINTKGYFLCAQACVPHMLKNQATTPPNHCCGKIISISSINFWGILANFLAYNTSKAAVVGFTRALARELGPKNIAVNAIAPGAFPTESEKIHPDPVGYNRYVLERQSLKRRGTPEDIGNAVVFLAGPRSDFISGQLLTVDGGWVMS